MKVQIWCRDFLQRETRDKALRICRQVMAALEGLISLGIRYENQSALAQLFRRDNCWLHVPFTVIGDLAILLISHTEEIPL